MLLGTVMAWRYASLDLTLSHYDARGHLVVSRRIFDSITPGWQQIGAVWLPLPHLLNALPVQIDAFYRTGASAIAMSVVSFAVATSAIAWIVAMLTGSWLAAVAGALVFALNPNVLYLQATPMTEPLLMALLVTSIALLIAYCQQVVALEAQSLTSSATASVTDPTRSVRAHSQGRCLLSRASRDTKPGRSPSPRWRPPAGCSGGKESRPAAPCARLARSPSTLPPPLPRFTVFSRVVIGAWFASGFFIPENRAQGHPYDAVAQIAWGLRELSGSGVLVVAVAGGLVLAATSLLSKTSAARILPLALLGTAAVPWSAFMDGHPFRIRYVVPLIAVQAICAGIVAGSWRKGRIALVTVLLVVTIYELRPLDQAAPMVAEAQWDRPNAAPRQVVTSCLRDGYRGESVMASMGSLGHYMQDLSRAGFSIRDFLHEGNGDIWLNALNTPRPYVGWILIEEKAEGGDMLAALARERPGFLEGYSRVCEGAGLALYRRAD